jgi:phosphoribosylaminoimidazole carboxylase (NCAIR synthetase)
MNGHLAGLRILVLGAGALHEPAFLTWARHGYRVTLVDGEESWGYESMVDDFLAWEVYDDRRPDIDRLAKLAGSYDVVLTLSEMCQITAATVAARVGLRGAGVQAARLARDKARQRARAATAGLPTVRYASVDRAAAVDLEGLPVPPPWVVKPVDSGGSAAVSLVEDPAELASACARALAQSASGRCLVEEFVAGSEWSVEVLVVAGDLRFACPTAKTLVGAACFIERRHIVGLQPEPPALEAVDDMVRRMISLYQVDTAVCHLELRVAGTSVTPIEMAVRPAGDGILELVRLTHGHDLYADLAAALAGRTPEPPAPSASLYAGVEFLVASGTVAALPRPVDVAGKAPCIRYASPTVHEGEALGPLDANWSRAGRAVGTADSVAELERGLATAIDVMATAMGVTKI